MLTENQNVVVLKSFGIITSIGGDATALFCESLVDIDPLMERMFYKEISNQLDRLVDMLTGAVERFDDLEQLGPVMCDLIRRRMLYDVAYRYYDMIGDALLRTLEDRLGDEFTTDAKKAWASVYGLAAETMKQAAQETLAAAWIELRGFASRDCVGPPPLEAALAGA